VRQRDAFTTAVVDDSRSFWQISPSTVAIPEGIQLTAIVVLTKPDMP
jgi:hypothetical protein